MSPVTSNNTVPDVILNLIVSKNIVYSIMIIDLSSSPK